MNDPHGLTFHDGVYHLFFQCVPDSLEWRQGIQWGHAVSADLLHWEHRPVALAPGDGDAGCWSGSVAVDDAGQPIMFYTSVAEPDLNRGVVRIARTSDSDWTGWTKGEEVAGPIGVSTTVFRDPQVFRDGDRWRMLVGLGREDGTAGAEVFSSADLVEWEYDGQLAGRASSEVDPWTGTAWECPQLLRLPGRDLLLVSVWGDDVTHDVVGAVGEYRDARFDVEGWQTLTAGRGHYAGSAFTDADGRSCVIFWIRGVGQPGAWTGVQSVPYLVEADAERVRFVPHPSVESARGAHGGRPGVALDLAWSPGDRGRLRLVGGDGLGRAELQLAGGQLTIAVPDAEPVTVAHTAPDLRVLVDGPVLEVVADGGLVGLPLRDTADGLSPVTDQPLSWWHLS